MSERRKRVHHLCEAVEEILKQFGTTYTIDF
jgi:hypothetical protein